MAAVRVVDGVRFCFAPLTAAQMADELHREAGTLASLSAASGVDARTIVRANDVPFSTRAINDWVIASGGHWLPHVEGTGMVPGSPTGGWAVFRVGNKIWMPCAVAGNTDDAGVDWAKWLAAGAAVVGTGLALSRRRKEK